MRYSIQCEEAAAASSKVHGLFFLGLNHRFAGDVANVVVAASALQLVLNQKMPLPAGTALFGLEKPLLDSNSLLDGSAVQVRGADVTVSVLIAAAAGTAGPVWVLGAWIAGWTSCGQLSLLKQNLAGTPCSKRALCNTAFCYIDGWCVLWSRLEHFGDGCHHSRAVATVQGGVLLQLSGLLAAYQERNVTTLYNNFYPVWQVGCGSGTCTTPTAAQAA